MGAWESTCCRARHQTLDQQAGTWKELTRTCTQTGDLHIIMQYHLIKYIVTTAVTFTALNLSYIAKQIN